MLGRMSDASVILVLVGVYHFFFFQAEDGIRDLTVTGVQTCALPILATPLVSEATRDRELDRDLNSDLFSARLEDAPSEALRVKARPLIPEAESDSEPDRVLKIELFSPRTEDEPSEPLRLKARPLT